VISQSMRMVSLAIDTAHGGVRRHPPGPEGGFRVSHPARADSDRPDARGPAGPALIKAVGGRPRAGYEAEYEAGEGPDQGRSRRRAGGGASMGAGTRHATAQDRRGITDSGASTG
jgi:hypothetical protein